MLLKEFNFNNLKGQYLGLSIFVDDEELVCGFIDEVIEFLRASTLLGNMNIKSTNGYFNVFVIRL